MYNCVYMYNFIYSQNQNERSYLCCKRPIRAYKVCYLDTYYTINFLMPTLMYITKLNGPASVRCPQCSNTFYSETAEPIKAKFYVEPPWVGGMKVCSRHLGHMTKMATTPIYSKNPSKIFFSGTNCHETLHVAKGTQPIIVYS